MKKKPTKKELELVISNLIMHIQNIEKKLEALDNVFGMYIKYKKEGEGFQQFIKQKLEKNNDKK